MPNYHTCTPENPCDMCAEMRAVTLPPETTEPAAPPIRQRCDCCGGRCSETILLPEGTRNRRGALSPRYRLCNDCYSLNVLRCTHTLDGSRCTHHVFRGECNTLLSGVVCFECFTAARGRYCSDCGAGFPRAEGETSPHCPSCRVYYFRCADCGNMSRRGRIQYLPPDGGSEMCLDCFRVNYARCNQCGDTYPVEQEPDINQIGQCSDCLYNLSDGDIEHDNRYYETGAKVWVRQSAASRLGGSLRRFGVELEFCQSHRVASYVICRDTGWGACPDGTSGVTQEFKSPPMNGDAGLASVELLCGLAEGFDFEVSTACGFHLHLDMSEESELRLARIACAAQVFLPLWKCFVPPSRRRNTFCASDAVNGHPEAIASGVYKPYTLDSGNRYCAWNWQAYQRHKTLENRLHTGTMNVKKVVNWIRANIAFVEWARRTPVVDILSHDRETAPRQFAFLRDKVWESDLSEFYLGRAKKFGIDLTLVDIAPVPAPRVAIPGAIDWQWTDMDRRVAIDYYGRADERRLQQAYYEHRLMRRPPAFTSEILVGEIAGYSERMEIDP